MIVWSFSVSEHITVSDYSDMASKLERRGNVKEWGEYVKGGQYVTVLRGYVTVLRGYVTVLRGYATVLMGYVAVLRGYVTVLRGYVTVLRGYVTVLRGYVTALRGICHSTADSILQY
jgi:hypothetical protein